jgi:hypothetical protein
VIGTTKRVLGEKHPHTMTIIANLASTYWNQGRWKEAEELEVHVMEADRLRKPPGVNWAKALEKRRLEIVARKKPAQDWNRFNSTNRRGNRAWICPRQCAQG